MKAIVIENESLLWIEQADPIPTEDEVLIQVKNSAINRADLLQRGGKYPVPPGASPILGLECAGEILAVGKNVSDFEVGDPVCALLTGGGYAEKVAVPAGQVLPIPKGLNFEQAAAIPEVFATAYLNLYMEAHLVPGQRVLLHAGASGVGTAAIQLCSCFGNPSFVTVGNQEKIERCVKLGAARGAIRGDKGFKDSVMDWTDGDGVDVILDPVGAKYLEENLSCLALDGRLALIGLMGGAETSINLAVLLRKRIRVKGSTLRAQSIAAKTKIIKELKQRVWPLFENGKIQPVIDTVIPIEEAERAHDLVAGNSTIGKVILAI